MICPNCQIEMSSAPSFGDVVTIAHVCPSCGKRHVVSFEKPETEYNPFANPPYRMWLARRMFAVQASDWYFASTLQDNPLHTVSYKGKVYEFGGGQIAVCLNNRAVEKTVTYTDLENHKIYEWQAIAYIQGGGIYRYMYLNGALWGISSFILHRTNNPFNRWMSDPKEAILAGLNEAESITRAMACGEWAKA